MPGFALGPGDSMGALARNRSWRLWLMLVVVFAMSVWPVAARAQQAVSLASLQISIWPEYDRPTSLVILDGVVAAGVTLPAQLTVRIPAAAVSPNAVATTGTDGALLQAAYTTTADGGDIIITFTTTSAAFRVEYYDPGLVIIGDTRSYAFRWKSDYAVTQATLRVQEPVGASNLTGQPTLTPAGQGEFGLNYDLGNLGSLAAGASVSQDIHYTKSGSALSAPAVAPPTGSSQNTSTAAGGTPGWLPAVFAAVAVGLVLVGGGAFWYTRAGSQRRPATRHAVRPARRARSSSARGELAGAQARAPGTDVRVDLGVTQRTLSPTLRDDSARFCTQCGHQHQADDRFCRQCGAPVRD